MKQKVYDLLDEMKIEYEIVNHPALYHVSDNEKFGIKFDGCPCKNLFLRNKKKTNYYLVIMGETKDFNLKKLRDLLSETQMSFASEKDLKSKLEIESGHVSLFNIMNAKDKEFTIILDKELLKTDKVAFHPNKNDASVFFHPKHMEDIIKLYKISYMYLNL